MEVEDEEDFIAPFSPDFKDATEAFEKKKSFHPPLLPPPPAAIATPPSTLRLSVAGAAPGSSFFFPLITLIMSRVLSILSFP